MGNSLTKALKVRFNNYPLKNLALRGLRGLLNPWLMKWTSPSDYDLRDTLVIAGSPRSGTTWLLELVATLPGTASVFEPEELAYVPQAKAAGFHWHTYVSPDEEWPNGEAFLTQVLSGKVLNFWTTSHTPLHRSIRPTRWIVKFIRANLLLGWLTKRFPIRPPALIIRHPCATICSQLQQGWPLRIGPPTIPKFFVEYPRLSRLVKRLSTPLEYYTALWCIENYAPLALPHPWPFHLMSYEHLIRDGEAEIERLLRLWGMQIPESVCRLLQRPSQTSKLNHRLCNDYNPLLGWRRTLSSEQIATILRVAKEFGFEAYSEEPEPDYEKLSRSIE